MSDTSPAAPAGPPAKAPKGKSPVLLVVVVALVVASGAGAGAFYYARKSAPVEKRERSSERGIVTFEPFVVNLADANASRFLRISIQLVVRDTEEAEGIQKKAALLMSTRSAILEVLTTQTSDVLVTKEGKAALKKEIAEHAGRVLEDTKVIDVLFSDFVVQF